MKKIASILLLTILLFNWVGFRIVSSLLESRSNARLIMKLDNNEYRDSELISVKIPSSLPYYSGDGEYQRVDGEIEINNLHYNYVKRRVSQDTIEYLCIPNKQKTALKKASTEFYKQVNDLGNNTPSKKDNSGIVKMLTSDYDRCPNEFMFAKLVEKSLLKLAPADSEVLSFSISPLDPPPNLVS